MLASLQADLATRESGGPTSLQQAPRRMSGRFRRCSRMFSHPMRLWAGHSGGKMFRDGNRSIALLDAGPQDIGRFGRGRYGAGHSHPFQGPILTGSDRHGLAGGFICVDGGQT